VQIATGGTERAQVSSDGTFRVKGAGTAGSTDAVQFSGSAPASAMSLDASGRLLVGATSAGGETAIFQTVGNATLYNSASTDSTTNVWLNLIKRNSKAYSFGIRGSGATSVLAFNSDNNGGGTDYVTIDSSGNLLVGTTSAVDSERLAVTVAGQTKHIARFQSTNSIDPLGLRVRYTAASPNGTSSEFIYCDDSTALRMSVRSNGGIANYSANNVALSDARLKTEIQNAGSYLQKICDIPVRTFKYKDQTHDDLNLGVIAQEVEAVAPELVDTDGFGGIPDDGVPLKAIYQTDLQYALMKCIQELSAKLDAAEARIAALEGAK
jgi:hypothetical protein